MKLNINTTGGYVLVCFPRRDMEDATDKIKNVGSRGNLLIRGAV